ncbi:MAG TPA: hypothetical protein PK020_21220 [Ilumatobacteraceae bacterium]|nr:hypothetical protein [Ilumatobacteraceae bacterium]
MSDLVLRERSRALFGNGYTIEFGSAVYRLLADGPVRMSIPDMAGRTGVPERALRDLFNNRLIPGELITEHEAKRPPNEYSATDSPYWRACAELLVEFGKGLSAVDSKGAERAENRSRRTS